MSKFPSLKEVKEFVLRTLRTGQEGAITYEKMALLLLAEDGVLEPKEREVRRWDRALRAAVEELRDEGRLIASACREPMGLFFPATAEESEEFLAQLRSRVKRQGHIYAQQRRAHKARFVSSAVPRVYPIVHRDREAKEQPRLFDLERHAYAGQL